MDDLISRQAAIAHAVPLNLFGREVMMVSVSELENLPSAQPEPFMVTIDHELTKDEVERLKQSMSNTPIVPFPSVQPEQHTCVNCGRTVNNGGWYADGGTRCPIEEHYALPKDGYCHLWEKRNVTDDNYPERREE